MSDATAGALANALRAIIQALPDPAARELAETAVVGFLNEVESDSYAEWERRMGDDL